MYEKEAEQLQTIIDDSERIVFFGGAGVSTESDIPDFRSADGLYRQKYKYSPVLVSVLVRVTTFTMKCRNQRLLIKYQ